MASSPLPPSTPARSRSFGGCSENTTPTLPHSTSNRSLDSPSNPRSPVLNHHPVIPKNYHPYQIQTSSSSLLTRSNSSPSQPAVNIVGHRSSRSMSNLAQSASESESEAAVAGEKEKDRRRSMESPRPAGEKPMIRRSGTLPSFPTGSGEVQREEKREEDLPVNPKTWTPSELARYLGNTLRTGGPDGSGQVLPAPLVKDIETWVLRQQVSGRAFLRGGTEGWSSTSRAPPFLPLLQAISRRLRRSSLSGRLSGSELPLPPYDAHAESFGPGSVLMEEDEVSPDEELTSVRRRAHAFEASSSASESEDHPYATAPLRPQNTGDSDRSEGWKRWSNHLGKGRTRRTSMLSNASTGDEMADTEASPAISRRVLSGGSDSSQGSADSEILSTPHLDDDGGMISRTIKAAPPGLGRDAPSDSGLPMPKADDGVGTYSALLGQEVSSSKSTPKKLEAESVTPRSERLVQAEPRRPSPIHAARDETASTSEEADSFSTYPLDSPHMDRMMSHTASGSRPYGALRRSSSSNSGRPGNRLPTLASLRQAQQQQHLQPHPQTLPPMLSPGSEMSDDELNDLNGATRLTTARRVTVRPVHVNGFFDPVKTDREKDMEAQLKFLLDRVKELEDRLSSAPIPSPASAPETTASDDTSKFPVAPRQPLSPMLAMFPQSVLTSLGMLSPEQVDQIPTRVSDLPAYLFLVGVGVGAIMARVMFGRAR